MTGTPRPGQPRQRNPRGHGDRLHSELLDAAVRVLAAHGDTERLSIRAVAAEAQVSPAAVYRHFPDRRARGTHHVVGLDRETIMGLGTG